MTWKIDEQPRLASWLLEPIQVQVYEALTGVHEGVREALRGVLEPTLGLQVFEALGVGLKDLKQYSYIELTTPVDSSGRKQFGYEPSIPVDSFGRTQVRHQCQPAAPFSTLPEQPVRSPEIGLSELTAAVAEHLSDNYRYDEHSGKFEHQSATSKPPPTKSEEAGQAVHADGIKKTSAADSHFGTDVGMSDESQRRVEFKGRRGAIARPTEALIKAGVYLVLRDDNFSRVKRLFATQMVDFATEQGLWGPDDALVANSGSAKAVANAVLWAVNLLE